MKLNPTEVVLAELMVGVLRAQSTTCACDLCGRARVFTSAMDVSAERIGRSVKLARRVRKTVEGDA